MVWTIALALQDQVDKVGGYAGLASFVGLAVLSLLYFAQAREVRRLRDWAGRAPERDRELEERVTAQAESARRVQAEPQRAPVAAPADTQVVPVPAPGGNGRPAAPVAVPMGPRPAVASAKVA